ncbi:Forkhead-associated (FHA) domain protein [Akanthomyces lecanii RCEF 1005]|uniref:Forkhead-associated (FHA) domain protein n=1 Tax=Akanthomyces lecanii RCEF 1005 TaxID=1081108 RepID=A0A162K5X3_CORDF|nr:Forkhead-associated (FHA) domain protein [Akanthomyces lecanii RCEF 1005]
MGRDNYGDGDSRRRRDHNDDDRRGDGKEHRSRRRSLGDEDADRRRHRSRERRRSRTPESASRSGRDSHSSRQRDRSRNRERRHRRTDDDRKHSSRRHKDGDRDDERSMEKKSRASPVQRSGPLPSQEASFAVTQGEEPEKPKEKANFGNTGLLAAASNSVTQADGSTVTLKYHEPSEARKPSPRDQWKLYIFKGDDIVDTVDLSSRSCWLIGREMSVVDLAAEHPSISKQHAVIQFRYTERRNEFGDKIGKVRPYLIDLESANGTMLNSGRIQDSRYLELRDKDMVQFGQSTREYVVMLAPRA